MADAVLGAKIWTSFLQSDRTYGTRRVWHDLLAEGEGCGLRRIERLVRPQALRARPRQRQVPAEAGPCHRAWCCRMCSIASLTPQPRTANGWPTSRISGRPQGGSTSPLS